jgi:hypothetical protein
MHDRNVRREKPHERHIALETHAPERGVEQPLMKLGNCARALEMRAHGMGTPSRGWNPQSSLVFPARQFGSDNATSCAPRSPATDSTMNCLPSTA